MVNINRAGGDWHHVKYQFQVMYQYQVKYRFQVVQYLRRALKYLHVLKYVNRVQQYLYHNMSLRMVQYQYYPTDPKLENGPYQMIDPETDSKIRKNHRRSGQGLTGPLTLQPRGR